IQALVRILVVGTGGVGGYYGARLAQAGNEVCFVARGANLDGLRRGGLDVRSDFGDLALPRVNAMERDADVGRCDAALICVKAYDNGSAAQAMTGAVGAGTILCSLHNGVDNEVFFADRFPDSTVIAGTTRI